MKIGRWIFSVLISLMPLAAISLADEEHQAEPEPYVGSPGFERMKQLVGSWEGEMDMGKGPMKMKVSYKLTSGGSAIIETYFEGAPHEMVSVYHDTPTKQLSMTHYCMLRNQPKMMLISMEGDSLKFDLAKDAPINVAKEHHMHALTIRMTGKDAMTQRWLQYKEGKADQTVEFSLERVT